MTPPSSKDVLHGLIGDNNAARKKARADYAAFLQGDNLDQASLRTAMEVLGKNHDQVMADLEAVEKSNDLAAKAAGHEDAQKQWEMARENLATFLTVTRAAALADLDKAERVHRVAIDNAGARRDAILHALLNLRRLRAQRIDLAAAHLAKDPAGSPNPIRIGGILYDPNDGYNPITGI